MLNEKGHFSMDEIKIVIGLLYNSNGVNFSQSDFQMFFHFL